MMNNNSPGQPIAGKLSSGGAHTSRRRPHGNEAGLSAWRPCLRGGPPTPERAAPPSRRRQTLEPRVGRNVTRLRGQPTEKRQGGAGWKRNGEGSCQMKKGGPKAARGWQAESGKDQEGNLEARVNWIGGLNEHGRTVGGRPRGGTWSLGGKTVLTRRGG